MNYKKIFVKFRNFVIPRPILKKLLSLSLLLLVGLVATSLAYDLGSNLNSDFAIPQSRFEKNIVELRPPYYGPSEVQSTIKSGWKDGPHATLTFRVRRLIPTEGRLAGFFSITIPKELEPELWDTKREHFFIVNVQDRVSSVNVLEKKIPLTNFLPSSLTEAGEDSLDFEIPIEFFVSAGSPQAYPSDWYWTYNFIEIIQPPAFYLPLELVLKSSIEMADKRIIFTQQESPTRVTAQLNLLVTRNDSTKRFVYIVALLPLALCFFLGYLLFFSQQSRRESEAIYSFLLEIAAAMLAVLPLRVVVVPSDIRSLTRVDFILGMELVAMVCLALVRFSIQILYPSFFSRSKVLPKTRD